MIDLSLVCDDAGFGFWGLIDPSIAPNLMFYSYIPIVILTLLFSLFVYIKNKDTLSKFLVVISLIFSFWTIFEILNWIAIPVAIVAFTWQMQFLIVPSLFLFTFLFSYNFLFKKNLDLFNFSILSLIFLPIILALPTSLNFLAFDIHDFCGNIDGLGWIYVYFFELLIIVLVLVFGIKSVLDTKLNVINKIKKILITSATAIFLTVFFLSTTFADFTSVYEFNLLGPIGMLLFIMIMSYSITKYKLFNIKVLGAQFLLMILIFGNFSQLFIRDINNVRIVTLATLFVTIIVGYVLIKSVKLVDKQREQLSIANENQENLLHFITHQVKGFMTKSRNIFSGIIEGDYGEVTDKLKDVASEGLKSETKGVETIQNILKASDLRQGVIELNKETFDIKDLLEENISRIKNDLQEKGLELKTELPEKSVEINGDKLKINEVIKNVIDNSIVYTQEGFIEIKLKTDNNKAIISVKDSGVGILKEDMSKLFKEGGKGTDSLKYNVNTTGYGLYIAKQIVDEHKGSIKVYSEGRGKGSEFVIELPL